MKTIQTFLFLVFISGSSILMINSGRVSPQIEQQQNSYWNVIANAQSEPVSGFAIPEPEQFSQPVGIIPTRSTGYHPGYGRGGNANRNLSASNRNLSQNGPLNPLHSRIIQSTLQPIDLIISPLEAATYATTMETKMQYVTRK